MAITAAPTSNNPFDIARSTLIGALLRLRVPRPIGRYPTAGDFESIRDHIREAAALYDAWLADIGHQVRDNAVGPLDMTVFDRAFSGAIDGEAMYVCEIAAQQVRDDVLEMVS